MQKNDKAWLLPSEMSIGREAPARNRLVKKYLSGVQGYRGLLEEFRCLASNKRDKEYLHLGGGRMSPHRNTQFVNNFT